jgi:hypothetical protein
MQPLSAQSLGGVIKEFGLVPHDQPVARGWKVCRIFVANTADCAGFAGYAGS